MPLTTADVPRRPRRWSRAIAWRYIAKLFFLQAEFRRHGSFATEKFRDVRRFANLGLCAAVQALCEDIPGATKLREPMLQQLRKEIRANGRNPKKFLFSYLYLEDHYITEVDQANIRGMLALFFALEADDATA